MESTLAELSMEKRFEIVKFNTQVDCMNLEQAQTFLKELYTQMIIKDVTYQKLLKDQWLGLD